MHRSITCGQSHRKYSIVSHRVKLDSTDKAYLCKAMKDDASKWQ